MTDPPQGPCCLGHEGRAVGDQRCLMSGLEVVRRLALGDFPWQRCQFQLQQNLGKYVARKYMRKEVAEDIRTILNAPERGQQRPILRDKARFLSGRKINAHS